MIRQELESSTTGAFSVANQAKQLKRAQLAEPAPTRRYTAEEILATTGADVALLRALEEYGLVDGGHGDGFDETDREVVQTALELSSYGVEPRHLRIFRVGRRARGGPAGAAARGRHALAQPRAPARGARGPGEPGGARRAHAPPHADLRAAPDRERVSDAAFDIDAAIRKIPDHPHPGILFYDLMPLFQSPGGLTACVDRMAAWRRERQPELVLAAEARGLILGGALAQALGVGVAAARKPRQAAGRDRSAESYALEYGTDALELHADAVRPAPEGARSRRPAGHRRHGAGALPPGRAAGRRGGGRRRSWSSSTFLPGRERLRGYDVLSLVTYDSEAA